MTTYAEYNERKVQLDLVEWPDPIVVNERTLTDDEVREWRKLTGTNVTGDNSNDES